jgi:hypothetical protein
MTARKTEEEIGGDCIRPPGLILEWKMVMNTEAKPLQHRVQCTVSDASDKTSFIGQEK